MKFCENLQKLRKAKNISQEQLAEMLGVTRQSVSKWESGASYPEMEKLVEMCKIFHCSLDVLVNGNALEEAEKQENSVLHSIMNAVEVSVKKTIALLENMNASQIIKFLLTLLVIGCVILVCKIPFTILEDSIRSIFYHGGGNAFTSMLAALWSFLLNLAYGIFAIVGFIYIYKVKYLDRIELTDDEGIQESFREEVVVTKQKQSAKKQKYVYQDHSGVFDFLTTLILYFVKFICAIVLVWDLLALITSMILLGFVVFLIAKGLILVGPILIGIAVIIFAILVAVLLINFIAGRKSNGTISLITLFSSLAIGCVGVVLSLLYFSNITYINGLPEGYDHEQVVSEVYDMKEDMILSTHYNARYEEDETLTDKVAVDLKYHYKNYQPHLTLEHGRYIGYQLEDRRTTFYPREIMDDIIKNLKQKKLYNYDQYFNAQIVIRSSKENIEKIKKNTYYEYFRDDSLDMDEDEEVWEDYLEY